MTKDNTLRRLILVNRIASISWIIIRAVLIIGICYVILYPLISKISFAFMDEIDLYDNSVRFIPKHFTLETIIAAAKYMQYPKALWVSASFCFSTAILQTISCTLTAYGFARFHFKYKNVFFAMVIISMVIPPQTILIPLYVNFRDLNLLNSLTPFYLLSITATGLKNGLYIFILRQFFISFPKELDEAALVDGSGPIRTFTSVILPNSISMMVTVFLFSFVWQWSDSFYTGILASDMFVMPYVLSSIVADALKSVNGGTTSSVMYSLLMTNTSTLLAVVPLLVLFIFGQRFFVEGIERSGIVG